jgi:hypothetical protein
MAKNIITDNISSLYPKIDFSITMAPVLTIAAALAGVYIMLRIVCYVMDSITDAETGYTWASLFGADRKRYEAAIIASSTAARAESDAAATAAFEKRKKLTEGELADKEVGEAYKALDETLAADKRRADKMNRSARVVSSQPLSKSDAGEVSGIFDSAMETKNPRHDSDWDGHRIQHYQDEEYM